MNRRGFLQGILIAAAAPAIVRADSLMRIVPRETIIDVAGFDGIVIHASYWSEPSLAGFHDQVQRLYNEHFSRMTLVVEESVGAAKTFRIYKPNRYRGIA